VTAAAETPVRRAGVFGVLLGDRHDLQIGSLHEEVELALAVIAVARLQDDSGFHKVGRRHPLGRRVLQHGHELWRERLTKLATEMEGETRGSPDATKLRMLAGAVRELAATTSPA
jgi:hypothetical protein